MEIISITRYTFFYNNFKISSTYIKWKFNLDEIDKLQRSEICKLIIVS